MGESINLVNNFKVEKVIFNCGPYNDLEKELIKVLDKKKIPYYSCVKELNIDNNKLYFLNNKDYGNENDNSSVIYTKLNNHKFLFNNSKVSTLWTQLTWSHLRLLFNLEIDSINYYIQVVTNNHISVRELEYKLKSNEFERLPLATRKKLAKEEIVELKDIVPNPIFIKNDHKYEIISEKVLQKLILEDITTFLKELGSDFTFIDNEYKIKLGDRHNYIDLLLYNIKYKCYVVVELKITELKKEHTGQIMTYMNYIDKNIKTIEENKTVGIIICKRDNKYVIEFCSDDRIIARKYELVI